MVPDMKINQRCMGRNGETAMQGIRLLHLPPRHGVYIYILTAIHDGKFQLPASQAITMVLTLAGISELQASTLRTTCLLRAVLHTRRHVDTTRTRSRSGISLHQTPNMAAIEFWGSAWQLEHGVNTDKEDETTVGAAVMDVRPPLFPARAYYIYHDIKTLVELARCHLALPPSTWPITIGPCGGEDAWDGMDGMRRPSLVTTADFITSYNYNYTDFPQLRSPPVHGLAREIVDAKPRGRPEEKPIWSIGKRPWSLSSHGHG
ncbi:uncharacterized protein GIQ15_00686 [Arthroderma uncinatum]|uniref:uncharacterized protein n=1 Tax=Arthroderma uncinatum TaxID=74035 RepID=UPI00144A782B|nr:uncharacterized protein GIQ15_00686 [Arthroderma uncinatum]KAF3491169.1 hypothetical protein GIQ15_00686 [Arthroderma uncinatum]